MLGAGPELVFIGTEWRRCMARNVAISYVNLPQTFAVERQIQAHVAALEGVCVALAACRVQIELRHRHRHRHHAPGAEYYVSLETDAGGACPRHHTTRSAQESLTTALEGAFSDTIRYWKREEPQSKPCSVSAHVVQIPQTDGTGLLATDDGSEIRFGCDDVAVEAVARLHMGDRVWWTTDGAGPRGRVIRSAR